ncbi:uncharacterized protein LOC113548417 [Rhopalosiphum maidis]|uniref:uncharacterized protein LOC113548417 n=1 Tax=Rhopalosiphum maidis TaxID=43146 RepID=UPI000F0006C1|nr:uncharacterized protein LOC113548417 [Rhopalosiphum maidis]
MVTIDKLNFEKNHSIAFRSNLRGITLKATTVISEPNKFKGFYPFADTDLDTFAQMHYDLNMILQDQLNFKIDLGIVDSFGWNLGNGSFSGLTGQLQREEIDFGGIGSFIRKDRMTAIDYTVGTFYRQPAALFKQPPLSSVHNICILPFKFEVWMVTLFTFIGFTILIAFLSRTTRAFKKDEKETLNVLESVTIVHGAICQQGYTMNLNAGSIRVAIFVLFLTAVFLFTSYSASIVALLQSPSNSIKTINDLVESSMTFSAQITPYSRVYFDESDDPLLRKLYDKKMKSHDKDMYTDASTGITRIRTEFHGFLIEVVSAYKLISQLWREEEKCGISEIQLFKLPILALAVVKRSGYKDILKQKLMQQQEVGLKNRIIRRWIPAKPMCDSSNRANQFVSVSIKEIYPMLQIYGFGLCLAIAFDLENLPRILVVTNFFRFLDSKHDTQKADWTDVNDLIKVISNFFIQRHVQTITAATCWPTDVNEELLKTLSTIDKSLSFHLFAPQTYATWYRHGFIVDLSCDRTLNFMHKLSKDRLFNLQNDWLLFNQNSISNTNDTLTIASVVFETYLGKSYVLPDSGVFLFQEIRNNVWEIWSGFRASKLDTIRVFKTGLASEYHIEISDSNELRTNFRGANLRATTVIFNPSEFVGFNQTTTSGLDVYAYMHYPMIQILAYQLNFNYTMSITDDHGWSYGNGSFFGLTGILQREESDFGAAGSLMRLDRMTAVDFTVGTETTNEILRKLYDMKIKPYDESKSFTNASMGIERIRTEFHGFMVEKTSAYQIINKKWSEEEKCGLYEIQLFKLPVLAIPVVKKSGHKDVFKQKLIQQHEVGIRKRVIQRWTPQKPFCDLSKRNRKYVSVSIKAIFPTIMLFGYGLLISLTVFMLELAYYYFRHVQTVTAAITCWPFDVNKRLLDDLSTVDISVSFRSPTLQTQYYSTWYRCAFIIDLSCENSTETLQQISNDRLFNTQNDWILFDQSSFANETSSAQFALRTFQVYLANAYVLPDASVFLFIKTYGGVWEIWSGFRASKSDSIRVFEIGKASSNRLTIREINEEKRNFRGATLKSTTVIIDRDHFFGFDKKITSDLDVFAHMHYEMIVTLTNQLNFKIELTIVNDYGWSLGNGSFGGLTGLLQKEAIDFSATGVFIRPDRMSVIDFTVGTVALRTTAIFRQPSLSSVHNILLLPFTSDVWISVCATFCVFVITLIFLIRVNNYFEEKKYSTLNVPEIVTLVHGAICQQGFNSTSTLVSIRVVIFVLFFTSLFIYTSYSASIAALVQSNSNSIKSIKNIAESSMTFSAQISPYGKLYFEETEDSDLKKLYKTKMVPRGNEAFVRAPEGMERIRTEFHGFLVEVMSAYKIISKEWREEEKCGLGEIQLFKIPLLSIALVKKSGHKDIFKQKLIQQMEVGLSQRISSQWIPPKPSCGSSSRAKQYVSVSVKETYLTLAIFGYGICISLVIFILEVLHFNWMNRGSKKKIVEVDTFKF